MTSFLDPHTIFVLLLVSALLMAAVLLVGPSGGRSGGLEKWVAGLGLVAVAWFLIALRQVVPPLVSVALADAVMMAGLCLQVTALLEFGNRRTSWLLAAPALVLFGLLLPIRNQFALYTLVASFGLSVPLWALSVLAWKLGHGAARWPMALSYALGAALLQVRALHIWTVSHAQKDFPCECPVRCHIRGSVRHDDYRLFWISGNAAAAR